MQGRVTWFESPDGLPYTITEILQFLLFGWGCLFWQPLALQYGKRPVYLISMLATTVGFRSISSGITARD